MTSGPNIRHRPMGFLLPDWKPPAAPPRERMEGRWCRLEPLDPDTHAQNLFDALADDPEGDVWTYLAYGPFSSFASYRSWICEHCMGDDPLFFAIRPKSDDKPAGVASYLRIAPASGSIEVGHILYSPSLQRTPAATEAMFLM